MKYKIIIAKRENPSINYKILGRIKRNSSQNVKFKVLRKSDGQILTLNNKVFFNGTESARFMQGLGIIQELGSEHTVMIYEVLDFNSRIWIFMEHMDGGSFYDLI